MLPPLFCIIYTIIKNNYPGEPFYINIQSLINIIQDNNRVITTKNVRVNCHYFVIIYNGSFQSMLWMTTTNVTHFNRLTTLTLTI